MLALHVIEFVEQLFAKYGYWVLLVGLPLDAIALPIPPGNTTLTYTGYLARQGVVGLLPAAVAAFIGAIIGMTATYAIGYKLGQPLIERYGKWLLLKPEHVEKTRRAYQRHGNKLLLLSYLLPGFRQFIGYFTGIIRVPFRVFALYAYTGAAIWVTVFVGIGYLFSEQWQLAFRWVERSFVYLFIGGCVVLVVRLVIIRRRKRARSF